MKRVDEKLRKPDPEGRNCVGNGKPFCLYVALGAKMENLRFPIAIYGAFRDTMGAKICFTFRTGPQRGGPGMIVAEYAHTLAPSPSA